MEKKEMKDLLELAKRKGRIRDVKEAFIEYPVEQEWHKGKIENIFQLNEDNEEYCLYKIGDIVFVNDYRYDNGAKGKNHLFVIIEQNNLAVPIENFGMLISSNLEKSILPAFCWLAYWFCVCVVPAAPPSAPPVLASMFWF